MLRRTLIHEDIFEESVEMMRRIKQRDARDMSDVMRAYHYFVVSWMGRAGLAGTSAGHKVSYSARFTGRGGIPAHTWNSAVESIPTWRRRLKNVMILSRDGIDLLSRIDDELGTAIYCDPPYLVKAHRYLHDFDAVDHSKLAAAVARFKLARVVVSYYDHPALETLYPGWTRVTIEVNKVMSNAGRRGVGQTKATEVLLLNGPSYAPQSQPCLFARP